MKIELHDVKVSDLVDGYADNQEGGVVGYHGQLNIRPKYQREFIYSQAQAAAVIQTVMNGFPLNTMYWIALNGGQYEVMDGQQRTLSICQYISGDFSVDFGDSNPKNFFNLKNDEKDRILNYCLTVYFCTGTESEKLAWFKTVNIAGEKLTDQELRNAVYAGPWVTNAKRHFSKTGCVASKLGGDYITGSPIRQELLEKVLKWIAATQGQTIEQYMADHQNDADALAEWTYFQNVISWIEAKFEKRTRLMKGLDWGRLYNEHKSDTLDKAVLEKRISELLQDDEVTNQKGVYEYVLTGKEKFLNLLNSESLYVYYSSRFIKTTVFSRFFIYFRIISEVYHTFSKRAQKARRRGQMIILRLRGCTGSRDRAGCGSRWTAGAPPYPRAGCRSWRHVRG